MGRHYYYCMAFLELMAEDMVSMMKQLGVHAHAICEEFRAAATADYEHDHDDLLYGRRISCPVLVLWSANNALDNLYYNDGGPLAIWRGWADDVQGQAIRGGHFFPEEAPDETANVLMGFFAGSAEFL